MTFMVVPDAVAFDSANGYVYVANYHFGTISIISTSPQVFNKHYSATFTESGYFNRLGGVETKE